MKKVVRLTESQLEEIVRRVINENVSLDGTKMKASQAFWDHVKEHEGNPNERVNGVKEPMYNAYKDSVGVWTIGYGHTSKIGSPKVTPDLKIDKKQALDILYADAKKAADCVRRIFKQWNEEGVKYFVTQGQFDALVSLVFNAGCTSVRMSKFIEDYKKGDIGEAAVKITKFNLQGGAKRRREEALLFLSK